MTRTVDQAEAELDFDAALTKAVTEDARTIKAMSPAGRLALLTRALTELELPTDCLGPARELVDRSTDLHRRAFERSQRASIARADALRRLVADPGASLDDAAAAWLAESPWLDPAPGENRPPAARLVEEAERTLENQIDGRVQMAGETLFELAQGKCRAVVAEVKALPTMPKDIWLSGAPAEDLPKYRQHRSTWGELIALTRDFNACHRIADVVRDVIGASSANLSDGAPRWSLVFRGWLKVLDDQRFPLLKESLRLPYAIEHGFEPGLWRPEDVKVRKEDQTFAAKLRNLGSAVGVMPFGGAK